MNGKRKGNLSGCPIKHFELTNYTDADCESVMLDRNRVSASEHAIHNARMVL